MTSTHKPPGPAERATERWTLTLTAIASLMVALDVLVVSAALGTIRHDLHASLTQLEWTVNAYSLSFAVLLIPASVLGDRAGRRRMFAAGLGVFTGASVLCALAPSVGALIAARVLQGAGAAIIAPLSLSLLSAAFPPARRGAALGVYGGITGLAVLGGPVLGGAVTQGLAWPFVFWINVPIGLIAMPLVTRHLQESHGPRSRFDALGLVLITGASFGLVWGLIRANTVGWGSAETVLALGGGLLLGAAFVLVQRRGADPMLPMRLFASRGFSAGSVSSLLLAGSLFGAVFFMAQFQQLALGQGPLDAGLRLLPWTGTVFVVAPLAGAMIERIGERPLVATGLGLHAAGMAWIALVAGTGVAYASLVAPMVISGVGLSMAIPAGQSAVVGAVGSADVGRASGVFTMMRQLGAALGIAIAVAVFAGAGGYGSPHAFSDGFTPAIAAAAVLGAAAAGAGLLLPGRSRREVGAGAADALDPASGLLPVLLAPERGLVE
ncbi:MAG TPA: MFS transporter [Solirubrobacteraceae bacterium]|nr:MFS transporter [Solirubrobacteraceae bacterium]